MRKIFFLLSLIFIFNYVCADLIKIPLKGNPDIRFLQQKLYTEEVTINGKVEVLYNVVEFYCLEGLVIVKLPDNKEYVLVSVSSGVVMQIKRNYVVAVLPKGTLEAVAVDKSVSTPKNSK